MFAPSSEAAPFWPTWAMRTRMENFLFAVSVPRSELPDSHSEDCLAWLMVNLGDEMPPKLMASCYLTKRKSHQNSSKKNEDNEDK